MAILYESMTFLPGDDGEEKENILLDAKRGASKTFIIISEPINNLDVMKG